jgi:alkyl hydroperoxide reductase subunit F
MYELIIIGGGPAGMTAAVYAARKKINTLLIARNMGGQVVTTSGIENYMGYQYIEGLELMDKFEQQIKQFPIDRRVGDEVLNISFSDGMFKLMTRKGEDFQAKTIIVATGKKPRQLNVPGEKELIGRGLSYCSVCDGPLFSDERVAVIGGGNSALEAIDDLLKIAEKVYSIMEGQFTGDPLMVDRVKNNSKLSIYCEHVVTEIKGNNRVEEITIQDIKTRVSKKLEVGGIFIEIGLNPNSAPVKDIVKLNANQEIEVNCRCETNLPGLFAAGDVANTPEKQIIIAAGEGAKAALQAHRYLQRGGST